MLIPLAFATLLTTTSIPLPGGPPVAMDYLAFDAANQRLWVPAGNTGNVDVLDVASGKLTTISSLPTAPSPRPGRPNMGPSSATVGDGAVWVGNRAGNELCAFDAKTLKKGECVKLQAMPDGLSYIAATKELWATTPREQTLTIVEVARAPEKARAPHATIKLAGDPEGYAVDEKRGIYYTNLEDKDKTIAVDIKTRKVVSTWSPGCGAEGPRGLALDTARRFLFVACTDGAVTLDLAHDGKPLGRLKTGGGVDNIDYSADKKLLYVASGKDGMLTIASVSPAGALDAVATAATEKGARVVVVDGQGTAYVADSAGGRLVVVKAPGAVKAK